MRKSEVGMRNLESRKVEVGILKHRAKSIAHRVEQRTVLRFRVLGVREQMTGVRKQMTDDRGQRTDVRKQMTENR
jgi:hypothetical protein